MPKIAFLTQRFQERVLDIIAKANDVITSYQAQGYTLTVRQLYYVFVAKDLFPDSWIDSAYNKKNGLDLNTKNTLKNYKRLASILNDARMCGLTDWYAIEDRTRWVRDYATHAAPSASIISAADNYAEPVWDTQDVHCEVWIEKDALIGIIERPCNELRVPYFPTRGYVSQSEAFASGERLRRIASTGKRIVIFHLGDHDPSGLDMSRDNEERLMMFSRNGQLDFRRLALTWEQVQEFNPPPNPAKETDSRHAGYQASYGDDSWELDALEPAYISELVRANIESLIDRERFDARLVEEEANRSRLLTLSRNWEETSTLIDLIEQENA